MDTLLLPAGVRVVVWLADVMKSLLRKQRNIQTLAHFLLPDLCHPHDLALTMIMLDMPSSLTLMGMLFIS